MKTLVIHPADDSTVMLEHVYAGKDYTVITDPTICDYALRKAISEHDKIIMLGHGTPGGLINPLQMNNPFSPDLYLIGDKHAQLLRTKESVSVWCFSDRFFRRHNIPGFHTGMIISEQLEARMMLGYVPLTADELFTNMVNFATIIGEAIEKPPLELQKHVLANYVGNDDITKFNRKNVFVLESVNKGKNNGNN